MDQDKRKKYIFISYVGGSGNNTLLVYKKFKQITSAVL